ncbi:MAG: hypothetical protein REI09_13540 [Candidatus Dactylopiibacterium sp.]|nr:hypothetical protein [Candidatus Dactylopiibacterium sp.]
MTRRVVQALCCGGALLAAAAHAQCPAQATRLQSLALEQARPALELSARLQRCERSVYVVRARAGQAIVARLEASEGTAYVDLLPPAAGAAPLFVGARSGAHLRQRLAADGEYRLVVYPVPEGASGGRPVRYTLRVALDAAAASTPAMAAEAGFERTLSRQGITFYVSTQGVGATRRLRIAPRGLEVDNRPVERLIEGRVTDAVIEDLNADGSPEVYVFVRDAHAAASLVAYAANRRRSLSEIHLPPLDAVPADAEGYAGHDEFALNGRSLRRSFPVFEQGRRTPRTRQLQYTLHAGEAGWVLRRRGARTD